ncbi:DUF4355 domain-containing protein [Shouchella lehensis]|uniref:DUF4355 domain-containing protein n=1 Tax=Shouchella lehensis TaxID=300825 RepID=A0A4Y7WDI4_9BACI|nr:DUF4355 domain-containing protein [Shouchella lehensis]MBG9783580.1 hypothetical protein [Shouchella lehensis]TES45664.1 DUF4355 domain-containing protein [Shouchella lehensis]
MNNEAKTVKLRLPMNIQYFSDEGALPASQGGNLEIEPSTGRSGGQQVGGAGGNEQPALTLDAVQAFLNGQESGKAWLQSFADGRVTDAIKTYESKTLPKKLDEEIAKRYPPETEDQKKMRALQEQLDNMDKEKKHEKMLNYALKEAGNYGISGDIVEHFLGKTEDETKAALMKLYDVIETRVEAQVNERLKGAARSPKDTTAAGDKLTIGKLKQMTTREVAKLDPEEVNQVLSQK